MVLSEAVQLHGRYSYRHTLGCSAIQHQQMFANSGPKKWLAVKLNSSPRCQLAVQLYRNIDAQSLYLAGSTRANLHKDACVRTLYICLQCSAFSVHPRRKWRLCQLQNLNMGSTGSARSSGCSNYMHSQGSAHSPVSILYTEGILAYSQRVRAVHTVQCQKVNVTPRVFYRRALVATGGPLARPPVCQEQSCQVWPFRGQKTNLAFFYWLASTFLIIY